MTERVQKIKRDHPELEAEVKEKVSEMLENRGGQQVISHQVAVRYLRKTLGAELAALMCSVEEKDFNAFGRTTKPKVPSVVQNHNIAAVYVIVDILMAALPHASVQDWLTSYNEYLYGIPAIEIYRRPDDVRMAALHRISSGPENNAW